VNQTLLVPTVLVASVGVPVIEIVCKGQIWNAFDKLVAGAHVRRIVKLDSTE
jgi:hypothetical protein